MEISYWWFLAEFWILCGMIGYSMFSGEWHRRYNESLTLFLLKESPLNLFFGILVHAFAGPYALFVMLVMWGWTERDGMWL